MSEEPGSSTPRPSPDADGTGEGRGVLHDGSGPGAPRGVVLEAVGGRYQVLLEDGGRVTAFLRGRIKREARTGDRVVAGDRVEVAPADESEGWVIEAVMERQRELVRAGPRGRRPRVVAANVDQVVVVMSADEPPFRTEIADRFLVLAESCQIDPVLVINKMDLEGGVSAVAPAVEMYREVGYPVVGCSAVTREGLDELRRTLVRRTSALVGPSGVGKSSLLNALDPTLELPTREVSRRHGRGRHTTVAARLLVLDDGTRIIDTPGFSEVSAWGIEPADLDMSFPEFRRVEGTCRFRRCSHVHEPDCVVKEALEAGEIRRERYDSYVRLLEE